MITLQAALDAIGTYTVEVGGTCLQDERIKTAARSLALTIDRELPDGDAKYAALSLVVESYAKARLGLYPIKPQAWPTTRRRSNSEASWVEVPLPMPTIPLAVVDNDGHVHPAPNMLKETP